MGDCQYTLGGRTLEALSAQEKSRLVTRLAAENIMDLMISEFNKLNPIPVFEVGIRGLNFGKYEKTQKKRGLLISTRGEIDSAGRSGLERDRIIVLNSEGLWAYLDVLRTSGNRNPLPANHPYERCDLLSYFRLQDHVFEALEKVRS
jgi:hypothetical protein